MRFNPCEGFGGFGTHRQYLSQVTLMVSIPVRDLVVLEQASSRNIEI